MLRKMGILVLLAIMSLGLVWWFLVSSGYQRPFHFGQLSANEDAPNGEAVRKNSDERPVTDRTYPRNSQPDLTDPLQREARRSREEQIVRQQRQLKDLNLLRTQPWQKRIEYGNLPVKAPTLAATPDLGAYGRDRTFRAMADIKPAAKRQTGFRQSAPDSWDQPKRLVHGRVYELREGERVPLAGVLVTDHQDRHRTFTDEHGKFEFEAHWSQRERKPRRGDNPANPSINSTYSVWLNVSAVGYERVDPHRPFHGESHGRIGEHFYERELETPKGAEIYMKRLENELIEVRLTNLHLARGEVTVCLSSIPGKTSILHDERMAITTVADEEGRAWFSVPPDRFRFHGVSGEGVSCIFPTWRKTQVSDTHVLWEVPLEPCNNFLAQGAVTDIRNGNPVPNAVVRGSDFTELTFTGEQGRFALWLSREPREQDGTARGFETQRFHFEADGYLWFSHPTDSTKERDGFDGTVTVAPGGDVSGPWLVALRPWVEATGRIDLQDYVWHEKDMIHMVLQSPSLAPGYRKFAPISPDGTFRFENIPWGLTSLRAYLGDGEQRRVVQLSVDPDLWRGPGPYVLTAIPK